MLGRVKPHRANRKLDFWRGLVAEEARSSGLSAGALFFGARGYELGALSGGKTKRVCASQGRA